MKIEGLRFEGVRRFGDTSFSFSDAPDAEPRDLVVFYGGMGSGKTLLLDVIAAAKETIAPYGAVPPGRSFIGAGESAAKVIIDWSLSEIEMGRYPGPRVRTTEAIWGSVLGLEPENDADVIALLSEYSYASDVGKVEYFHAPRDIPRGGGLPQGGRRGAESEKPHRLSTNDRKYAGLPGFLVEAALVLLSRRSGEFAPTEPAVQFGRAFELLCPTKRFRGVVEGRSGMEPAFADSSDARIPLSQLSQGERQAALFAATFVRSGINDSVVLIDTPELFLPSDGVVPFLETLRRLGQRNQLIVATSSREVANGFPSNSVIALPGAR
jgi:hypothetical protein